jgi:hypothetical protein
MKKLIYSAFVAMLFISQSCVGPEGPPGPQGFDGYDGVDGKDGEEAYVFEFVFDFESPDYGVLLEYPDGFTALDSDVVLVYLLWDTLDDGTEVWRLLPQSMITDFGFLQYNFDFTKFDARVFLDSDFNLDNLGSPFLDNWLARVVVVPGQFSGRMDYTDYDAVKETFNLPDKEIPAGYVISERPE